MNYKEVLSKWLGNHISQHKKNLEYVLVIKHTANKFFNQILKMWYQSGAQ